MIPAFRVPDLEASVDFYTAKLGFTVARGAVAEGNVALARGDERMMLEAADDFFSPPYNDAIRARLGSPSAHALYLEEPELERYYGELREAGVEVVDPLAPRPWGQSEFTIADRDGNWLTFWSRTP